MFVGSCDSGLTGLYVWVHVIQVSLCVLFKIGVCFLVGNDRFDCLVCVQFSFLFLYLRLCCLIYVWLSVKVDLFVSLFVCGVTCVCICAQVALLVQSIYMLACVLADCLVGLVVRHPPRERKIPGFFRVESYQ